MSFLFNVLIMVQSVFLSSISLVMADLVLRNLHLSVNAIKKKRDLIISCILNTIVMSYKTRRFHSVCEAYINAVK